MKYERLEIETLELKRANGARITTELAKKVLAAGSVDTENYRYISKEVNGPTKQWIEIRRLPIKDLDTTAAIDGWTTVCTIGETD